MSKIVYKYPLHLKEEQEIIMPDGAKILHIGDQNGTVTIWALVPVTKNPKLNKHTIYLHGTGNIADDDTMVYRDYLGSVEQLTGFVWHLFRGKTEPYVG